MNMSSYVASDSSLARSFPHLTTSGFLLPVAHAGHWLASLLYLLPVVLLGAGILFQKRQDKRRADKENEPDDRT
jgi:uncharacterized membrane protein